MVHFFNLFIRVCCLFKFIYYSVFAPSALQEKDIFCCVADCGWITGHTYIVYGPLLSGGTTVMFESVPTYPNPYRYILQVMHGLFTFIFV